MDRHKKEQIKHIQALLDGNAALTVDAPDGVHFSVSWYAIERAYWLTWEYPNEPSEQGHGQKKIQSIKLLGEIMLDVAPIEKWQPLPRK